MSNEAALLRAVHAAPADDTPRLVYADWLTDQGRPERADFIRTQVALAGMADGDPARPPLEDREHELLAEHEGDWLSGIDGHEGVQEWEFRRGFLDEIAATPRAMTVAGDGLFADHPVTQWRVMSREGALGSELIQAGREWWCDRLKAINLGGWNEEIDELEPFLTRSAWAKLEELDLAPLGGIHVLPSVLEKCQFRSRLTRLGCAGVRDWGRALDPHQLATVLEGAAVSNLSISADEWSATDARQLLTASAAQRFTVLHLSYHQTLEPDVGEGFRAASCRLRELDLSGTPLGAIGLADVLNTPACEGLRSLHLNHCGSAHWTAAAITGSPFWRQAEELRMHGATLPAHLAAPLFESPGPPSLRVLDLGDNYLGDVGVLNLCGAPWIGSLEWLGLSNNGITDDGVRTLADHPFPRLRTLHLSRNMREDFETDDRIIYVTPLTDVAIRAIVGSKRMPLLRVLTLAGTGVGNAGADALLHSPSFQLSGLGIASCEQLSADVVWVIAATPRLARLNWLDLSRNRQFGGNALMPLAESPYLSPLCELDIGGCGADDRVVAALRGRLGRRLSV